MIFKCYNSGPNQIIVVAPTELEAISYCLRSRFAKKAAHVGVVDITEDYVKWHKPEGFVEPTSIGKLSKYCDGAGKAHWSVLGL